MQTIEFVPTFEIVITRAAQCNGCCEKGVTVPRIGNFGGTVQIKGARTLKVSKSGPLVKLKSQLKLMTDFFSSFLVVILHSEIKHIQNEKVPVWL